MRLRRRCTARLGMRRPGRTRGGGTSGGSCSGETSPDLGGWAEEVQRKASPQQPRRSSEVLLTAAGRSADCARNCCRIAHRAIAYDIGRHRRARRPAPEGAFPMSAPSFIVSSDESTVNLPWRSCLRSSGAPPRPRSNAQQPSPRRRLCGGSVGRYRLRCPPSFLRWCVHQVTTLPFHQAAPLSPAAPFRSILDAVTQLICDDTLRVLCGYELATALSEWRNSSVRSGCDRLWRAGSRQRGGGCQPCGSTTHLRRRRPCCARRRCRGHHATTTTADAAPPPTSRPGQTAQTNDVRLLFLSMCRRWRRCVWAVVFGPSHGGTVAWQQGVGRRSAEQKLFVRRRRQGHNKKKSRTALNCSNSAGI